jgi:hypothetical protein
MKTDWASTKVYNVSLNGITDPWEIINKIKQLNIKSYTYEIRHKNTTINYGMSDATTTQQGERIYRQIGHLDSFKNKKLVGPNGSEFLEINKKYKNKYGVDIDHNDITIIIWCFDNYNFRTLDSVKEIMDAETELIDTYKNQYGELAIGNIDDNKLWRRKSAPRKDVWSSIFEEDTL